MPRFQRKDSLLLTESGFCENFLRKQPLAYLGRNWASYSRAREQRCGEGDHGAGVEGFEPWVLRCQKGRNSEEEWK